MSDSYDLGREGEKQAAFFLEKKNYIILERNYRRQKAEVDLIVRKKDILVAVEVKVRSTDYFGTPSSFVSKKKIQLLTLALDHYVNFNELDVEVRFDIISILKQGQQWKIEHIEDAFNCF